MFLSSIHERSLIIYSTEIYYRKYELIRRVKVLNSSYINQNLEIYNLSIRHYLCFP